MFGIQIWLFFFCRCVTFVVVVYVYVIWRWIESDLSWHCLNTIIGNQTVGNHLKRSIIRTIWLHSGNSANNIDDSSILSSLPKIKWLMKILLKNMQTARISPRRQHVTAKPLHTSICFMAINRINKRLFFIKTLREKFKDELNEIALWIWLLKFCNVMKCWDFKVFCFNSS